MLETSRANLGAVATIAWAAPRRLLRRRKKAPKALLDAGSDRAAGRSASAARFAPGRTRLLRTFPPVIRWCGQSPNQLQNWFSVGPGLRSLPIALNRIIAVR